MRHPPTFSISLPQVHRSGGGSLRHTLSLAGPSLCGAALTTAGAAAPLLFCRIVPFRELGELIIVCTAISLAVALSLFAPLLSLSAPPRCCRRVSDSPPSVALPGGPLAEAAAEARVAVEVQPQGSPTMSAASSRTVEAHAWRVEEVGTVGS